MRHTGSFWAAGPDLNAQSDLTGAPEPMSIEAALATPIGRCCAWVASGAGCRSGTAAAVVSAMCRACGYRAGLY